MYSLYNLSIKLRKSAEDTMILGLIKGNELACKNTVSQLSAWCAENFLELNVNKMEQMAMYCWKHLSSHAPQLINHVAIKEADSVTFLCTTITGDLKWDSCHQLIPQIIRWLRSL